MQRSSHLQCTVDSDKSCPHLRNYHIFPILDLKVFQPFFIQVMPIFEELNKWKGTNQMHDRINLNKKTFTRLYTITYTCIRSLQMQAVCLIKIKESKNSAVHWM